MESKVFSEECRKYWEATHFKSQNQVKTAYDEIKGLFHFQDNLEYQQISSSVLYAMLRGSYSNTVSADSLNLALYLIVYGKIALLTLHKANLIDEDNSTAIPYSRIAGLISDDEKVQQLKKIITTKSNINSNTINMSGLSDKVIFYGLRSSRVEEEPAEDGLKPQCVVGYLKVESTGVGEGYAFIYFGQEKFQRNGELRTVDPIFLNSKGMLLFEYRLTRSYLPHSPENRTGFIKVSPNQNRLAFFEKGEIFKGIYRDFDPKGVGIDGAVELEVVSFSDEQFESELKLHAERFNLALNE